MPFKRLLYVASVFPMLLVLTGAKSAPVTAVRDQNDPDTCLSVEEVTYAPGQASQPHRHKASVVAYVLKGSVQSQIDDGPLRTYGPGEHWTEAPGALHAVSRNANAKEPATFLAILLARKGTREAEACGY